jgi:hypothetical protein
LTFGAYQYMAFLYSKAETQAVEPEPYWISPVQIEKCPNQLGHIVLETIK